MSDATQPTPALEVRSLGHSFGRKRALEGLGLTLACGEFKVLLGLNGAGKTTLFSLITRLYDAREGEIRVNGRRLSDDPTRALARMGVVFQQPTLDLDLTVRQNLAYHAALHGLKRADAAARMEAELMRLGMAERRHERVRELNGGHRRRVEIARALLHGPDLLLLDEPTVGLDAPTRADIVDHVHALAADDGIAVLWATHLMDEVRQTDSVLVLHQGRKRAEGMLAEVLAAAGATTLVAAFAALTQRTAA
ncbi:MAG: ABC transporter ATP-binding protein [Rhodospirillales bacterium]